MKRFFITIFLILTMAVSCGAAALAQEAEFDEVSIDIQYDVNSARLVVSGVTPAKYNQRIIVAAYKPAMESGLTQELRTAKDPAAIEPLTTSAETPVFRLDEITAKKDGSFSGEWYLNDGIENGTYMIIKLSGAGSTAVSASKLFYFESPEHFQNVTLRKLESLTGDTLGEFLVEKRLLLALTEEDSYYLDNETEKMFAAVRDNDFKADAVTGHLFNSTSDITTVLNRVKALQNLPASPTQTDIAYFIRDFGYLLSYDFSSGNADYTLMKENSHILSAGIFTNTPPVCFTDVEKYIEQAIGLAMINSKDSTTIDPVIKKYALIMGIDKNDYETYCTEYTSYEVNKAFVGKDFTLPSQVVAAFNARAEVLKNGGDKTSYPDGGNNGNGGGGGGKTNRPVSGTTNVGTIGSGSSTKIFSDVSNNHWAAAAIKELSVKNIVSGFPDGTFRPDDTVTREQLVKMLTEAFNLSGESDTSFTDVTPERWSAAYIIKAAANGIVKGTGDGAFSPEAFVTRQDAAVMLYNLCNTKGISLSGETLPKDSESIADYAKQSVNSLMGAGIILGFPDGSFNPTDVLTRAQSAKLIFSLLKLAA